MTNSSYIHFEGKDAKEHLLEIKAKTITEPHGFEIEAPLFAFLDTLRNVALLTSILVILFLVFLHDHPYITPILLLFSLMSTLFFVGRSTYNGFSILDRLHRNLKQEFYEIEHHRAQEREELKALYAQKGFEGDLLEKVVDVLMADDDRLLKVMLEEELGLSLESMDHPIKHGVGALLGGLLTTFACFMTLIFLSPFYFIPVAFLIFLITSIILARIEKSSPLPVIVWTLAVALLLCLLTYFSAQIVYEHSDVMAFIKDATLPKENL